MYCETCKKKKCCTELCSEMKKFLFQESKAFYKARFFEFDHIPGSLEHLSQKYYYIGQHTILNGWGSDLYHTDNIKFIRYLIDVHIPKKQKDVLIGYYFEHLKQRELAAKYKVSQPLISGLLRDGIAKLQQLIKDL